MKFPQLERDTNRPDRWRLPATKKAGTKVPAFRVAGLTGYRTAYSQQGIVTSSQQSPPSQQGCAAKTAVEANIRAKIASIFFMINPLG